jgi:hypothetical protein
MPVIQLASRELGARGQYIRKLLQPLSNRPDGPAWKPRATSANYIIGTHDGSPPDSDHREWRFATYVPNLRGMYFELWRRVDDEYWCLDRAYLNIFQTDPATRGESRFLSLHCDPNESDDAPHASYKKGPHLHVQAADDPFPHAHIALTGGHLDIVLSSVDSLSEAIAWAILMLKEEVLDAMIVKSHAT